MVTMVTGEKRKACGVFACLVLVGTCLTGCNDVCPKELKVTGPDYFSVSGKYTTDDASPGKDSVWKQVSWDGPGMKKVHYIRHWTGHDAGWGLALHASDNHWAEQVEGVFADCPNAAGWKWRGDDDKFKVEAVDQQQGQPQASPRPAPSREAVDQQQSRDCDDEFEQRECFGSWEAQYAKFMAEYRSIKFNAGGSLTYVCKGIQESFTQARDNKCCECMPDVFEDENFPDHVIPHASLYCTGPNKLTNPC